MKAIIIEIYVIYSVYIFIVKLYVCIVYVLCTCKSLVKFERKKNQNKRFKRSNPSLNNSYVFYISKISFLRK